MKQTEALKKAQGEYRKSRKRLEIIFSPTEKELYDKLLDKSQKEGLSLINTVKIILAKSLD